MLWNCMNGLADVHDVTRHWVIDITILTPICSFAFLPGNIQWWKKNDVLYGSTSNVTPKLFAITFVRKSSNDAVYIMPYCLMTKCPFLSVLDMNSI